MIARIFHIAANTFREAVRDRVLYNLVFFAILMTGSAPLFSSISIGVERIVMINLGLTAISLFGIVIAIFIGIGLVSKEIDRKTLYTVLSRPVRRWEFILGKYLGLAGTLVVNTAFMTLGFYAALFYVTRALTRLDLTLLAAIYFIVLELLIVTALAILFSSFSSPLLAALFSFAMFVIGTFSDDIKAFAAMARGAAGWAAWLASYVFPNFSGLNIISLSAHAVPVSGITVLANTAYALTYTTAVLGVAILIFERRNLQ